jgi:hypothetical protein
MARLTFICPATHRDKLAGKKVRKPANKGLLIAAGICGAVALALFLAP